MYSAVIGHAFWCTHVHPRVLIGHALSEVEFAHVVGTMFQFTILIYVVVISCALYKIAIIVPRVINTKVL